MEKQAYGVEVTKLKEYLDKLYRISSFAEKFRSEGLLRDEIVEMSRLVKQTIIEVTDRDNLPIIRFLTWLEEISPRLPEPISLNSLRDRLLKIRQGVFEQTGPLGLIKVEDVVRFARVRVRECASNLFELPVPPPLSLEEIVDQLDALLEGFSSELRRYITVLKEFINYAPLFIEELAKSDPNQLKTTLGEALCVWWITRVLPEFEPNFWKQVKGPLRISKMEIDALAIAESRGYLVVSLAEIKNADPEGNEFKRIPVQLIKKAAKIAKLGQNITCGLRQVGFNLSSDVKEVRIGKFITVTLNVLNDKQRQDLYNRFLDEAYRANLPLIASVEESLCIYDGCDMLRLLEKWRYKEKKRYQKMFRVIISLIKGETPQHVEDEALV